MSRKDTVCQSGRLPSLLLATSLIVGVSLFANFITVMSTSLMYPLVRTEADQEAITRALQGGVGSAASLLSFVVPSVLATIYLFPVYRACHTGAHSPSFSLAQRRLLNMPLVVGLIGMIGWLIVILGFVPGAIGNQVPFVLGTIARYTLDMFLTGSLVFVISYYLLEFISRKYFIPRFFPGGKLSECSGTLTLSIRARFYIFFFAVAIYPMLLMLGVVRAMGDETQAGDKLASVTILVGVALLVGAFLTYLISGSYQVPLVEMKHAAQRVQASDYEINIAVVSNDEVGNLGETLNEMAVELKESAILRAILHEQIVRDAAALVLAYDATIAGWSHALDLRDKETEGHTLRVAEMALALARAMGLSEAELTHLRRGALLHDIGKMGIPDSILHKPAQLTDEEWRIMRRHPTYAYEMLSPIDYLRPALDVPYCHHEKWDGSGYPRGLKGEQIPLIARIFAVADVWDALRSDRPYRAAWPEDKVRNNIREQAGTHFDPTPVEVFLRLTDVQAQLRGS